LPQFILSPNKLVELENGALCKEFVFTAAMFKGSLAEGRNSK
jgi:hypothetical protein